MSKGKWRWGIYEFLEAIMVFGMALFAGLIIALVLWSLNVGPVRATAPPTQPAQIDIKWSFSTGPRPIELAECPPETRATFSTNNGTNTPWRRFCWWGKI